MLEMLKERKAQLQAEGKKGFTLMEMLIVIAIIAVLIAIAIPIFTAQLEAARDATSCANLRSAYAEASAAYALPGSGNDTVTVSGNVVTVTGVDIPSTDTNFGDGESQLPFTLSSKANGSDCTVAFTFDPDAGTCLAAMS